MSQLTALKTSRSVKTRRLTVAEEDTELGKMARLAGVCREIFLAITAAKGIPHYRFFFHLSFVESSVSVICYTIG